MKMIKSRMVKKMKKGWWRENRNEKFYECEEDDEEENRNEKSHECRSWRHDDEENGKKKENNWWRNAELMEDENENSRKKN